MTDAIDPAVIGSLRQLNQEGEPDVVHEVLTLFLNDAPGRITAIADAIEQRDLDALHRAAHALKGAAGNIGARELASHCNELEGLGKAGTLDGAPTRLLAARKEFTRVKAEAEVLLQRASGL